MKARNPLTSAAPLTAEGRLEVERGFEIAYRIYGSGKRTLLGLHGGPGVGAKYLTRLNEVIGDDTQLVLYDQLGGGESDWPDDPSLWQVPRFVAGARDRAQRARARARSRSTGSHGAACLHSRTRSTIPRASRR